MLHPLRPPVRPLFYRAYLWDGKKKKQLLRPRSVLALTATASKAVVGDICATLGIPREGVRVGSWDRPNLEVRVARTSCDDGKLLKKIAKKKKANG